MIPSLAMSAILAWQYKSALSLVEALVALQLGLPACGWEIHDSQALGRYVMGRCEGVKIKVLHGDGEVEAWPPADASADAVAALVTGSVLPALAASAGVTRRAPPSAVYTQRPITRKSAGESVGATASVRPTKFTSRPRMDSQRDENACSSSKTALVCRVLKR